MAKEAGKPESREGVWAFFVQRVREQLHIVLAMSPVTESAQSACSFYSVTTGMQTARPGCTIFDPRVQK